MSNKVNKEQMINPLNDKNSSDVNDIILVNEAIEGRKESLEKLIKQHQDWIYNIVLRMVFYADEAKDITQEILIKVVTKLSSFEKRSSFRTWIYRITVNHILNYKKLRGEAAHHSDFGNYGESIDLTPDSELPAEPVGRVNTDAVIEEIKISCMYGMLLCLSREQRIVFILGAIFGATDKVASEILEITPALYRKRLSRARKDLYSFMTGKCGLVYSLNPCKCSKKTKSLIDSGYVNPLNLMFNRIHLSKVYEVVPSKIEKLENLTHQRCEALFRGHPFDRNTDSVNFLKKVMVTEEFKNIFNFN